MRLTLVLVVAALAGCGGDGTEVVRKSLTYELDVGHVQCLDDYPDLPAKYRY